MTSLYEKLWKRKSYSIKGIHLFTTQSLFVKAKEQDLKAIDILCKIALSKSGKLSVKNLT